MIFSALFNAEYSLSSGTAGSSSVLLRLQLCLPILCCLVLPLPGNGIFCPPMSISPPVPCLPITVSPSMSPIVFWHLISRASVLLTVLADLTAFLLFAPKLIGAAMTAQMSFGFTPDDAAADCPIYRWHRDFQFKTVYCLYRRPELHQ